MFYKGFDILGSSGGPFGDAEIAFGPSIVSPNAIWGVQRYGYPRDPGKALEIPNTFLLLHIRIISMHYPMSCLSNSCMTSMHYPITVL